MKTDCVLFCQQLHIHADAKMGKDKLIDELFSENVKGNFVQPRFIIDYPSRNEPADKKHRSKPGLSRAFWADDQQQEIASSTANWMTPSINVNVLKNSQNWWSAVTMKQ